MRGLYGSAGCKMRGLYSLLMTQTEYGKTNGVRKTFEKAGPFVFSGFVRFCFGTPARSKKFSTISPRFERF
jgi:hypothetical protein